VPPAPEYDAAQVGRLVEVVLFTEWRRQIAAGVSPPLLLDWRQRLASAEFMPGPARDLMALDVGEALAGMLGCEVADLPGSPLGDMPESGDDIPPGLPSLGVERASPRGPHGGASAGPVMVWLGAWPVGWQWIGAAVSAAVSPDRG
jgi:hypothetical protein